MKTRRSALIALLLVLCPTAVCGTIVTFSDKTSFLANASIENLATFDPPNYPTAPAILTTFMAPNFVASNMEIVLFGGGGNQALTADTGTSFSTTFGAQRFGFDILSLPANATLTAVIDGVATQFTLTGNFFGLEVFGDGPDQSPSTISELTWSGSGAAPVIDNAIIALTLPEPSTVGLILIAGLVFSVWRKNRWAASLRS
jgi:hypothetical protein